MGLKRGNGFSIASPGNRISKKTGYIGFDGVHPSDSARQLTAELLGKLGYEPMPPPQ